MSERKALNKYYPPDFDPSKIKRIKKNKNNDSNNGSDSRIMLPMTIRCVSCNTFLYSGKKFNAKKYKLNETYHGISVYQFSINCTLCKNNITFKTDPQNTNYVVTSGAVKLYDTIQDLVIKQKNDKQQQQDDIDSDILKKLENEQLKHNQKAELDNEIQSLYDQSNVLNNVDNKYVMNKLQQQQDNDIDNTIGIDELEAMNAFNITKDDDGKIIKRANVNLNSSNIDNNSTTNSHNKNNNTISTAAKYKPTVFDKHKITNNNNILPRSVVVIKKQNISNDNTTPASSYTNNNFAHKTQNTTMATTTQHQHQQKSDTIQSKTNINNTTNNSMSNLLSAYASDSDDEA